MSYYDNNDSSTTDISTDHSITTSVSIRVTPIENYYVSWGILWSAFVITSIVAAWQVYREHHIFHLRHLVGNNTATTTTMKKNDSTISTSLVGNNISDNGDTNDDNMNTSTSSNKQSVSVATVGDGESVSTADLTRSMVRHYYCCFVVWHTKSSILVVVVAMNENIDAQLFSSYHLVSKVATTRHDHPYYIHTGTDMVRSNLVAICE